MNLATARALAQHDRQVIGRVLGIARKAKENGEPPIIKIGEELGKASADLHRLYKQFPEIRPIRVKQLNLFE